MFQHLDLRRKGCSRVTVMLCFLIFMLSYSNYRSNMLPNYEDGVSKNYSSALNEEISKAIEPGSKEEYPTSVRGAISLGQVGQVKDVMEYFQNKKGGTFLEAGAFDGVYLSNTLYLEAKLGWTGLLIEPNKQAYEGLRQNNRKASSLNACLSPTSSPTKVVFDAADVVGSIKRNTSENDKKGWVPAAKRSQYELQCYPLYDILVAASLTSIDLWSLDIEGFEEVVLDTVPWDKVDINSILIEVEHSDRKSIIAKLQAQGYRIHKEFGKQDVFLVKD